MVHPFLWFSQLPFSSVSLILRLVVSGVLADPARIDEEFRKAWLPYLSLWTKGYQP